MALEIEKKFLVKYIPDIEPINISPYILQGYLKTGSDHEVRISNRLHLTQKSGSGLVREENIYHISQEVYNVLLPLTIGKQVEKKRQFYGLKNGLIAGKAEDILLIAGEDG